MSFTPRGIYTTRVMSLQIFLVLDFISLAGKSLQVGWG